MKDAIIILGAQLNPDGSLSDMPKQRVNEGFHLWQKGIAPRIIMSGNYSFWLDEKGESPTISEAEMMRNYAVSLGVPKNKIFVEKKSKDTMGNAYYTKVDFLKKKNWKNVVVITTDFHMARTKLFFNIILGPEFKIKYISAPSKLSKKNKKSWEASEKITIDGLKNIIGHIKPGDTRAVRDAIFKKHPGYAKNSEVSFEQLRQMLGRGTRQ